MDRSAFRTAALLTIVVAGSSLVGCSSSATGESAAGTPAADSWLSGTTDEKLAQIERHLRGLDVAMAEIGYRYGELLVAGKNRNWEYSQYQAEKIDLSMRLALERRPKRAKSSEPFLDNDLPQVFQAIREQDGGMLDAALDGLHASCVECHRSENVLHFRDAVERIRQAAQ